MRRRVGGSWGAALVVIVALAAAAPAQAQLGATPEEIEQRYGAGQDLPATFPAESARTHTAGGLVVEVEFLQGTVRRIVYRKPQPFSAAEISALLAANAGGQTWSQQKAGLNPVADRLKLRSWNRSDRGYAVESSDAKGGRALAFTDPVFLLKRLQAAAADAPPADIQKPHTLDWRDYDGTGAPDSARLFLDDRELGSGAGGRAALNAAIAKLPAKSVVRVVPYYGDPAGPTRRTYPLDLAQLRAFAAEHQVELAVPQAK